MKFICYNFLPVLADYIFDLPLERYSEYGIIPLHDYRPLDLNKLKNGEKIFVKTDLLVQFFIQVYPKIKNRFYLITGVSDYEIDDQYLIYLNDDKLINKLQDIITEVSPFYIVVGNPKHLSGENSEISEAAYAFATLLKSIFTGPIYFVDERLSTSSAYSQMREIGKSERDSKAVIDQIAAINILESAILNERSGAVVGELL